MSCMGCFKEERRGCEIVTECSSLKEVFVQASEMSYLLLCSAGANPQISDSHVLSIALFGKLILAFTNYKDSRHQLSTAKCRDVIFVIAPFQACFSYTQTLYS